MAAVEFEAPVTSLDDLREVIAPPSKLVTDKAVDHIDGHCRSFIARSPFVLVASSDGAGNFDVSPKGDPPGFVRVLDEHTLAIPERPGNHRADTFTNVLCHPYVGLIFLIPGVRNTLRVSGRATIVADRSVTEPMAIDGRVPKVALAVEVIEAFLHCAKCIIRSDLWSGATADTTDMSTLAEAMVDQGELAISVDRMQEIIDDDERQRLY